MQKLHNYIFLFFALSLTAFVSFLTFPYKAPLTVELKIIKSSKPITSIYPKEPISKTQSFKIDVVDFPHGDTLTHSSIGALGVSKDFYLELNTIMDVKEDGIYRFLVLSDDGFSLTIDDKLVSRFKKDREYLPTMAERYLKKGQHRLSLFYFQSGGPLGLRAEYAKKGENSGALIGEDSKYIMFSLPGKTNAQFSPETVQIK